MHPKEVVQRQMPDLHHFLRITLESVRDGVVITDRDARVQTMNAAAQAMTGWSNAEALGQPVEAVVNFREYGSDHPLPNPVYAALSGKRKVETPGHSLLVGRDGRRLGVHSSATYVEGQDGESQGCLLVFYDASEALRLAERMSYLAQHDPLTGLPNRILLVDRLEQGTRLSDRTRESLAVVFVDLDHFHRINETYSHAVADQLLKEVGYRLSDALRESDTVCRLGGDEFVLLLQGLKSRADVEALADKLLAEIARPYLFGEHTIHTTCSIGISLYPRNASDAGTLMRLADGAMHTAKLEGRDRCVFASSEAAKTSYEDEGTIAEASTDGR
jgi:diguanylate cyclase (GGDEF)-like protein/PAS domain S-box-containing protein